MTTSPLLFGDFMGDRLPEFESADKKGTIDPYVGTVGTSWTAIPTTPGGEIQEFHIECPEQTYTNELEFSLDGGTTSSGKLYPHGSAQGLLKGGITQIYLKGNVAGVSYKVTLSEEPS